MLKSIGSIGLLEQSLLLLTAIMKYGFCPPTNRMQALSACVVVGDVNCGFVRRFVLAPAVFNRAKEDPSRPDCDHRVPWSSAWLPVPQIYFIVAVEELASE